MGAWVVRRLAALVIGTAVCAGLLPATVDAAAAPPADDGARITARKWLDRRTLDLTVKSPALGESVKVRVLVPKGWSRMSDRTWPVLYAYHGGRDTYVSWTRSTDIERLSAAYGVLVVMPEGGWEGSYTDWYNYGRGGTPKWETFHTAEVPQLAERNLRAGIRRAAMGISSGAQGAVSYAARHPGMFRYAAGFSGYMHLTMPGIPALSMATTALLGDGSDPFRIWGVPGRDEANWRAHDPYWLAPRLRGVGLYISSGTTGLPGPLDHATDPAQALGGLVLGGISERTVGATTISFVQRLRKLGIPATTHLYGNGLHQWLYWQREMHTAWPLMMTAIGAGRVT